MVDHDPYPDEDTDEYEYTGTGLDLPDGTTVEPGETVALPDRIAGHISDTLADPAPPEPEPEPDDSPAWTIPPDDDPVWEDYNELRRLAKDTPVDGRQGMEPLVADLRTLRDDGPDAL